MMQEKFLITIIHSYFTFEATKELGKRSIGKRRDVRKLVASMGGFMILAGVMLLGVAVIASTGFLNAGLMFDRKYVSTFTVVIMLVGLFDILAAVIIARW